jgi:undecaprenyl-diphosphatase
LEGGPHQKLDAAVIAPRPTRRYRAAAFQVYVLGASAVFIALAVVAHFVPYFPIDLTVTHAVQSYHGAFFDRLMYWVSWLGFWPQVIVLGAVTIVVMFLAGLRWEAAVGVFAGCGVGVGTLVKLVVYRPRPTADLVHVFSELPSSGFPSGHVLEFTSFCGFLAFLAYTLLKPSWGRTTLLLAFALFLLLMGLSRIYQGQHWFSDVLGAYLLGSLWLALTIRIYRWGKQRFFTHQPVAPETPVVPVAAPVT